MKPSTLKKINKIIYFLSAIALLVMFYMLYQAVGKISAMH